MAPPPEENNMVAIKLKDSRSIFPKLGETYNNNEYLHG
jgi:hypothetical protein